MMKEYKLWESSKTDLTTIQCYTPSYKASNAAVVILPGGAYANHADYEGVGYAQVFNAYGMTAFVLNYRVAPFRFPQPTMIFSAMKKFGVAPEETVCLGIDCIRTLHLGTMQGWTPFVC